MQKLPEILTGIVVVLYLSLFFLPINGKYNDPILRNNVILMFVV
jgi:hypothetical protein